MLQRFFLVGALALAPSPASAAPDDALLSRDDFCRAVLAANPEIAASGAAEEAALRRAEAAVAWEDPVLSAEVAPLTLSPSSDQAGWSAELRQEIPVGGRRSAQISAAEAELEAARAASQMTRQDLALMALSLWGEWYLLHRELALNGELAVRLEELEASATAAYSAGEMGGSAPVLAAAERVRLDGERLSLERERRVVAAEMNALLRRSQGEPLSPPGPLPEAGAALPLEPSSTPELRMIEAELAMREADLQMALADRWPMVDLMLSYSTMWMGLDERWMAGAEVEIPLWQGAKRAEVDAALAEQSRLRWEREYEGDQRDARAERALAELEEARLQAALIQERLLPLARREVELTLAELSAGTGKIESVLEAEMRRLEAELMWEEARVRELDGLAAFDRALGRLEVP